MLLSLEALQAKHGDSLILHYGDAKKPTFALIDGGPPGVFKAAVAPRLKGLRDRWAADGTLNLEFAMVSHIDQDHVYGVMELLGYMEKPENANQFRIRQLWHNGFKAITGSEAAVPASVRRRLRSTPRQSAEPVVASVGEGAKTVSRAEALGIPINPGAKPLITAPGKRTIGGLKLTIVGPLQNRVDSLRDEWQKEIKASGVVPAAYIDESVFNLSSIVVVAELGKRRMLLTGDARGDDVIAGLKKAKLLDAKGRAHFDLLKVPHHGSDRNVATEFFRDVTADHYVISGNGDYGNPELPMLQMLATARKKDPYEVWFTYREGKDGLRGKLDTFLDAQKREQRPMKASFADGPNKSLVVDLGDEKVSW